MEPVDYSIRSMASATYCGSRNAYTPRAARARLLRRDGQSRRGLGSWIHDDPKLIAESEFVIGSEADARAPASALANDLRAWDFSDDGIWIVEWPLSP